MINTTVDGAYAYATSDLVSPHPTKKDFYKIVGRADDQIMHSTGEKVISVNRSQSLPRLICLLVDEPRAARYVGSRQDVRDALLTRE